MENIKVKRHENRKIPTCLLIGVPEMNERKDAEEIFETIMADNFYQLNVRHQNTIPGSSENTII